MQFPVQSSSESTSPSGLPTLEEAQYDIVTVARFTLALLRQRVCAMGSVPNAHGLVVQILHPVRHGVVQLPPLIEAMFVVVSSG